MEHTVILQLVNALREYLVEADETKAKNTAKFLKPIVDAYRMQIEDELEEAKRASEIALMSDDGFSRRTQDTCDYEEQLHVLKRALESFLKLAED